jgi:hypothetical protein
MVYTTAYTEHTSISVISQPIAMISREGEVDRVLPLSLDDFVGALTFFFYQY